MFHSIKNFLFNETKRRILSLTLAGISLVISFFNIGHLPLDGAWIAIALCGLPIIKEAVVGLATKFDIKADLLVSLALVASILIGEIFAAGEVAFIMQIGALLEQLTVARARAGIEKLVHLTPRTARLVLKDAEKTVPAEQVQIGDLLRVLPGETIPVDGIIMEGDTSVNQAVMTGEALPVDKSKGDPVSSGTVNQFGAFDMKATKAEEDSSIQRMIRLVQSADAGKAKIVGIADRWATWIVIIALSAAALTWYFTGELIRAVTILVVFCPCSLVLATPTAIMAAIGNATKHGFLVREGDALERLATVKRIAFDKTGTLTYGNPKVVAVHSFDPGLPKKQLYQIAAAAELRSEHPLGKAIVASYRQEPDALPIPQPEEFAMIPGRGVWITIAGQKLVAGNLQLLTDQQITLSGEDAQEVEKYRSEGCTLIYLGLSKKCCGFIALSDTIRQDASQTIRRLKSLHISPVLLTGDNGQAAGHIAKQVGIEEVYAACLPESKLNIIGDYQEKNQPVCMMGDGVNDAPALKKALVGIAMGGIGSDVAIEAADIALIDDDIQQLPHLFGLAQKMMTTIRLNLTFSMVLNFVAILLAMSGILNPVVGALVHNAGSVLVIVNSALLLGWQSPLGSTV